MAIPRKLLVDSHQAMGYHLVSRCVRRVRLCGKHRGRSYDHRKAWIEERILHLAKSFAVDIWAYAVMSNHFHVVVYYDPTACRNWSNEEIADRWIHAFPPANGNPQLAKAFLLSDPDLLEKRRTTLGCMSKFMKHLKQPIALRVNREDGVTGHMFEQRFYSGALVDEQAVLTAMRYVDLNPHRAEIAETLEASDYTSVRKRLESIANRPERVKHYLAPVAGGIDSWERLPDQERCSGPPVEISAADYLALLEETMSYSSSGVARSGETPGEIRWAQDVALMRKRQRAYGGQAALERWLSARKLRPLEHPLSR